MGYILSIYINNYKLSDDDDTIVSGPHIDIKGEARICYGQNNNTYTYTADFYENDDIKAIFDISGGDIANEILDYLDYDIIKRVLNKLLNFDEYDF